MKQSGMIAWIVKRRAPLVAVAFWGALLLVARQYMTANDLTFAGMAEQLAQLLTDTWYGPIIYITVYLLRPLILFPASLLTILGGSVFGLFPGFFYVLLAGTLSALFPYAMGRWFAPSDQAEPVAQNILQRFVGLLRRNPLQAVITLRLLYLPYDAVSFVVGNLRIPFVAFFVGTLIGNVPGTFAYTGIGAALESDFSTGEITLNPTILLMSLAILIVSLGLSRALNVYQSRQTTRTAQEA